MNLSRLSILWGYNNLKIKLTIAYDGGGYNGFQSQSDKKSVQDALCAALEKLYGEKISVTGSGRTDAGVHALGQVVHYEAQKEIEPDRIKSALNFFLPQDLRVRKAEECAPDFNARKSAKKKTYRYDIYFSDCDNPLLFNRAHRLWGDINIEVMKKAAQTFIGVHDFKEFYCKGSSAQTTVREVYDCVLTEGVLYGEKTLSLEITASGFLYKMVRLITGAIIKAGEGKISLDELKLMADGKKEYPAKLPAPACGLYLLRVEY